MGDTAPRLCVPSRHPHDISRLSRRNRNLHLLARGDEVFPRVFADHNIVEAFPNAFIGVTLPDAEFESTPGRGDKFDWLYDRWVDWRVADNLKAVLHWEREAFWRAVIENKHHDERAALVCALTALCVLRGLYVAVGEPSGGYFFLPLAIPGRIGLAALSIAAVSIGDCLSL